MDHQGSFCCVSLKWRSGRYDSMVNTVGPLDAEKLAAAVLLHVLNLAFPASLFQSEHIFMLCLHLCTQRWISFQYLVYLHCTVWHEQKSVSFAFNNLVLIVTVLSCSPYKIYILLIYNLKIVQKMLFSKRESTGRKCKIAHSPIATDEICYSNIFSTSLKVG